MIDMKATTKADVMTVLRQSFDFGDAELREFNDQQLNEGVLRPQRHGNAASACVLLHVS